MRIAPGLVSAHSTRISIVRGSAPSHSVFSMVGPPMHRMRSSRGRRRKHSNSWASAEYALSRFKMLPDCETSAPPGAAREGS